MRGFLLLSLCFSLISSQSISTCPFTSLCNSHEVSIAQAATNNVQCHFVGDIVSLNLRVNLSTTDANRRFDAQIYVGVDAQGGTLNTGSCARFTLSPLSTQPSASQLSSGHGPYLDAGDGNTCGDLPGGRTLVVRDITGVNVRCADQNRDGLMDPVTACVAFNDAAGGANACVTNGGSTPCACASVQLAIGVPADVNGCEINPCPASYSCADVVGGSAGDARQCFCPPGTVEVGGTECQVTTLLTTSGFSPVRTASSPVTFNVRFGLHVTSVDNSKITVTGPAALPSPSFTVVPVENSNDWTLTIASGTTTGLYTVTMAIAAGTSGSYRSAAATKSVTLDLSPPSVTVNAAFVSPTNDLTHLVFTVRFSKPVFYVPPLTQEQFAATLGAITNSQNLFVTYNWLSTGNTFDIRVVPIAPGPITLTFPANVAFDDGGVGNTAGAPLTIVWDITPPSVVLTTANLYTSASPVAIIATFNEGVLPFFATAKDAIFAASQGISSVTSIVAQAPSTFVGPNVFTINVVPAVDGAFFSVVVPNVTRDVANNQNTPSASLQVYYGTQLCSSPGNGGCSDQATCQEGEGTRTCNCNTGYSGTGEVCNDINECSSSNGACAENAYCTNSVGSRLCECPLGFDGDGYSWCNVSFCGRGFFFNTSAFECQDVNECSVRNGGCLVGTPCTNTNGSYFCGPCPPTGWTGSNTPTDPCVDINECATNNGDCDNSLAECTNTPGSRTCCCNTGYIGSGFPGTCMACQPGFTSACGMDTCFDLNECATANGGCSQVCNNVIGSFSCGCNSGYAVDAVDNTKCNDINECETDRGGCNELVSCINLDGSRTCTSCPPGYQGSGVGVDGCADINECQIGTSDCVAPEQGGVCTNTVGGATCMCNTGYTGDGKRPDRLGTGCTTINFCATQNGGCDARATCVAASGSRSCTCNENYSGDGIMCEETNYCNSPLTNTCVPQDLATCTPIFGGVICSCSSGLTGTGSADSPCTDINECASDGGGCDVDLATCINTPGSFMCQCQSGYEGTGMAGDCVDINECVVENGQCDQAANCTNTPGSRTCACNEGFFGDGVHCTDRFQPVPIVTSVRASGASNVNPVRFYVTFQKTVPDFASDAVGAQLIITNGVFLVGSITTEDYAIEQAQYTVGVTPATDGKEPLDITLQVPAGIVHDWAPHPNVESNVGTVRYVTVFKAPNVTAAATTNTNPVIDVDFLQTTLDFDDSKAALIKAAGTNIDSVQILPGKSTPLSSNNPSRKFGPLDVPPNSQYHIIVTPQGVGPVTFTFPAGVATDAAGNTNEASTYALNIIYDPNLLAATVTATQAVTNSLAVFRIVFNKDVMGFNQANSQAAILAAITNANAVVITAVSASTYTISATPITSGQNVVLTFPAHVAMDSAGNYNVQSAPVSILFDTSLVVVNSVHAEFLQVPTTAFFTVTFSKPVVFPTEIAWMAAIKAATLNSATVALQQPIDGVYRTQYNVFVTPVDNTGTVLLTIPAGVVKDVAGNLNSGPVSADNAVSFLPDAPTMSVTPRVLYTNVRTIVIDVTSAADSSIFVRDVQAPDPSVGLGLILTDLNSPVVSAVKIESATAVSPSRAWIVTLTVGASINYGVIRFYLPDFSFSIDGQPNARTVPVDIVFDAVPPSAIISVTEKGGSTSDPVFTLNFTESVTFPKDTTTDLKGLFDGGVAFEVVSTQRANSQRRIYDLRVRVNSVDTPWLNLTLRAGVASDLAGNLNQAVPTYSLNFADVIKGEFAGTVGLSASSNRNEVWIPVGLILGLIVLFCICCVIWWWYNKHRHEEYKDTSDEAVPIKEVSTGTYGMRGSGQTGESDERGNEAKREYDDPVEIETGGTIGVTDSDDEDSQLKAKRVGSGYEQPVYHIHYQAEESENRSEAGEGTGLVQSSAQVPESPAASPQPDAAAPAKNSGALVWL